MNLPFDTRTDYSHAFAGLSLLRVTVLLFYGALIGCAFFIPLSATVADIFFVAAIFFSLFIGDWKTKLLGLWRHPVPRWAFILFFIYVGSVFYTQAPVHHVVWRLSKESNWVCCALLAVTPLPHRIRKMVLNAFLGAMVMVLALSYIKFFWIPDLFHTRFDRASVFKDHIVQSFLMSLVTFIFFYRFSHAPRYRWGYLILGLLGVIDVIFLNSGRTGYLILMTLSAFYALKFWQGKLRVVLLLLIPCVFAACYFLSPVLNSRLHKLGHEIKYYDNVAPSSSGIRIASYQNALALWQEKPWVGHGAGSFYTAYQALGSQKTAYTGIMRVSYNAYLNTAVEVGILGLLVLGFFFLIQWVHSSVLSSEFTYFIRLLWWSLIIGGLINPWLTDTTPLHLYTLFLGIAFSHEALAYATMPQLHQDAAASELP